MISGITGDMSYHLKRFCPDKRALTIRCVWTVPGHVPRKIVAAVMDTKISSISSWTRTTVKKTAKTSAGMKKGSKYACGVCGLSVTVDTACGCAETACLICCEKPMKTKR